MLELSDLVTVERAASGHPQWVFVDEAQDLIGADGPLRAVFDPTAGGHVLASYRPEQLSALVLANADTVLSTSSAVDQLLGTGSLPASMLPRAVGGHAVLVQTDRAVAPRPFTVAARRTRHHRHLRKYLHHPVPAGRGFRFRPGGVTLPEARSVEQFRSQVEGVGRGDVAPASRQGDVSRWLAEVVQDRDLSDSVARLEHELTEELGAAVGRARAELTAAIDRRYRETAARGDALRREAGLRSVLARLRTLVCGDVSASRWGPGVMVRRRGGSEGGDGGGGGTAGEVTRRVLPGSAMARSASTGAAECTD